MDRPLPSWGTLALVISSQESSYQQAGNNPGTFACTNHQVTVPSIRQYNDCTASSGLPGLVLMHWAHMLMAREIWSLFMPSLWHQSISHMWTFAWCGARLYSATVLDRCHWSKVLLDNSTADCEVLINWAQVASTYGAVDANGNNMVPLAAVNCL